MENDTAAALVKLAETLAKGASRDLTLAHGIDLLQRQQALGIFMQAATIKAISDLVRAMECTHRLAALSFIEQCPEQSKQASQTVARFKAVADALETVAISIGEQAKTLVEIDLTGDRP